MIPTLFVILDSLPLTPNGKLDRISLTSKYQNVNRKAVSPRNNTEKEIALIWKNVLNLTAASIYDHFDDVGGDSLRQAYLFSKIEDRFQIKINFHKLNKQLTIADLAQYIYKVLESTTTQLSTNN